MEIINITIPDNLDAKGELAVIAKHIGNNLLPTNNELLGSRYVIKHLKTQININREPIESVIVTRVCSVCSIIFEQTDAKKLWVSYGGKQKQRHYCSDSCREIVLSIVGTGRASIKRRDLTFIPPYLAKKRK